MAELSTTKAKEEDFEFAWEIYEETMSPALSGVLKRQWDSESEKLNFGTTWEVEDSHIILLNGKKIGWLSYQVAKDLLSIKNLYISGEYQRKGIGTILIDAIVKEGQKAGVESIDASVLKVDSIDKFAEKQGFVVSVSNESKIVNQVSLNL